LHTLKALCPDLDFLLYKYPNDNIGTRR